LVAAAEKRSERWRKIVLEAAQQSRRVSLPVLQAVAKPEAAFVGLGDRLGIFLSERAEAPALRVVLKDHVASQAVLAIGPEGGWTDEERDAALKAGFNETSLGRLILRAETAVIAALASLSYALGD
jgi:16S rRNA (uracil1498-N3)-methyltransferase